MASSCRERSSTFEALDALSRTRPLSQAETLRLDRALRRRSEPKGQKRWTNADVRRLGRFLLRGKRPAQIAQLMNRTERAIWIMMWRQGWTVRDAANCAIALPRQK